MNFQEAYYQNPYQTKFESVVTACRETEQGFWVTLRETLFYPEGGGQPSDRGTLTSFFGTLPVLDVQDSAAGPEHLMEVSFDPGTRVCGRIDWPHRYHLMQNHTGEHIISGLVHQTYGYENVGFHMSDVITLDLSGPLTWEQAGEIERQANQVIYKNLPVEELYPTGEDLDKIAYRSKKELDGDVRIIHIDETDDCA